jgi:hypothetical protein
MPRGVPRFLRMVAVLVVAMTSLAGALAPERALAMGAAGSFTVTFSGKDVSGSYQGACGEPGQEGQIRTPGAGRGPEAMGQSRHPAQGDLLDVGTHNPSRARVDRGRGMATGTTRPAASPPAAPTLTPQR